MPLLVPLESSLPGQGFPFPPFFVWILVFWAVVGIAKAANQAKRDRQARREDGVKNAEDLLEFDQYEQAAGILQMVRKEIFGKPSAVPDSLAVRWQLAWGQCRAAAGAFTEAREALEEALEEAPGLEDQDEAKTLRVRAETELAFVAFITEGSQPSALTSHLEEALRHEPETHDSLALWRLAVLELWHARVEQGLGHWEKACACFERALRIALRVAPPPKYTHQFGLALQKTMKRWAEARSAGAVAATSLGKVLDSVGDHEGGARWLDRAMAALEGPDHPIIHYARAQANLERARLEPRGTLSGPARCASWLEAAAKEGLACGNVHGQAIACRAELELAMQFASLDDAANALGHARRAAEIIRDVAPGEAWTLPVEAAFATGSLLREIGDADAAEAELRRALDLGRESPQVQARGWSANASWLLCELLAEDRRFTECAQVLASLDALLPGLADEVRTGLAVHALRVHGAIHLGEGRLDAAAERFDAAEAEARRLPDPVGSALARGAAIGLGQVAMAREAFAEAEEHFRRALAMPSGEETQARRQASRASLLLSVAGSLAALGRVDEARAALREAFREGLASGSAAGRRAAANAALLEADVSEGEPEERRELCRTAARLGRLSGLRKGREIADLAEEKLRSLSE